MRSHWKINGLICLLLVLILFCGCRGIRAVAYETKYLVQRVTNDTLYHYLAQDEIEITSEPVKYGWRGTPCYIKDSVKYYYYEKGRKKVTASHSIASKNVIRYIECMQGLRQKVVYEFYPNGDTASITTVEKGETKSLVQFMNNQRVSSTKDTFLTDVCNKTFVKGEMIVPIQSADNPIVCVGYSDPTPINPQIIIDFLCGCQLERVEKVKFFGMVYIRLYDENNEVCQIVMSDNREYVKFGGCITGRGYRLKKNDAKKLDDIISHLPQP